MNLLNKVIKRVKCLIPHKRAKLTSNTLNVITISIVILVIFLTFYSVFIPQVQSSGNQLESSGVPLGGLFSDQGLVITMVMAVAFMTIIFPFIKEKLRK